MSIEFQGFVDSLDVVEVLDICFGAVLGTLFVHILVYMMDSPAAGAYGELFTMTWGN